VKHIASNTGAPAPGQSSVLPFGPDVETLMRYLPQRYHPVLDKLPPATSAEGSFAWRMATKCAVRLNGTGWFQQRAHAQLERFLSMSPEQLIKQVQLDPEFQQEQQEQHEQAANTTGSEVPA
jgi:hypothetical protein